MAGKGGIVGGIGKAATFLGNEKSEYFIEATVDVKGAVLDPSSKVAVAFK
jgi:hypothetical protein